MPNLIGISVPVSRADHDDSLTDRNMDRKCLPAHMHPCLLPYYCQRAESDLDGSQCCQRVRAARPSDLIRGLINSHRRLHQIRNLIVRRIKSHRRAHLAPSEPSRRRAHQISPSSSSDLAVELLRSRRRARRPPPPPALPSAAPPQSPRPALPSALDRHPLSAGRAHRPPGARSDQVR